MIALATIIAFSALVAVLFAGFVWYGWALGENLRAVAASWRLKKAAAAEAAANAEK